MSPICSWNLLKLSPCFPQVDSDVKISNCKILLYFYYLFFLNQDNVTSTYLHPSPHTCYVFLQICNSKLVADLAFLLVCLVSLCLLDVSLATLSLTATFRTNHLTAWMHVFSLMSWMDASSFLCSFVPKQVNYRFHRFIHKHSHWYSCHGAVLKTSNKRSY